MSWFVEFHPLFAEEFSTFAEAVQDSLFQEIALVRGIRPSAWATNCGYTQQLQISNMKELRFDADDGVWRTAFAFDPKRKAILLVAGDKSGSNQKRFYKQLIKKADSRFDDHLKRLKEETI